jgi:hypothetical protein
MVAVRRLAASLLATVTPLCLLAQAPARVSGFVQDSTGKIIADAGVMLLPGQRHARTDASGGFRFDSLAPGTYRLTIRRLGFLPQQLPLILGAGMDTILTLTMSQRPRLLDTVVVTANGCSRIYFDGFLCRRSTERGVFLTEADILEKNPQYVADLFLGMKGFHVEPVMTPYGPSRAVRTTESRCLTTLVDGRRAVMSGELGASSAMDGASGRSYADMEQVGPRELIGVEIYPPGYLTPEEYGGVALATPVSKRAIAGSPLRARQSRVPRAEERCVLVNYWTASSLRKPKARDVAKKP